MYVNPNRVMLDDEAQKLFGAKAMECAAANLLQRCWLKAAPHKTMGTLTKEQDAQIVHDIAGLDKTTGLQGAAFARLARKLQKFYPRCPAAARLAGILAFGENYPFVMMMYAMQWAAELWQEEVEGQMHGVFRQMLVKTTIRGELLDLLRKHDQNPRNKEAAP